MRILGISAYYHDSAAALLEDGQIVAGCVHDPMLREMYRAVLGGGAFLNDRPICSSGRESTDHALLVCSFSRDVLRGSIEVERFVRILCDTRAHVRRLGSAALNLCYVACGRLDGYWATSVNAWDVAAGSLILTESRGCIEQMDGSTFNHFDPRFIAAATPQLAAELRQYLHLEQAPTD